MDSPKPKHSGSLKERKAIISWCLFDWANSPHPTIVLTFVFSAYFIKVVANNEILGTFLWSQAIGLSSLLVVILAPILGAISDQTGRKKLWVLIFTLISIFATFSLWFVAPNTNTLPLALIGVSISVISFEICNIFYNATLSHVSHYRTIGRISGFAWGTGYFGAILCLLLCLFGLVKTPPSFLNLNTEQAEHIRATVILVGIWWLTFSWPFFVFVKEIEPQTVTKKSAVLTALRNLLGTLKKLKHYQSVTLFLLARMFYADGLVVVFQFGGIYAAGTFGLTFEEILQFGIGMNISAGVGAFLLAWFDDRLGSKFIIILSLTGLIVTGTALLWVESVDWFWLWGIGMSFFIGPTQAASRTLLARLTPQAIHGEMYGLFALSGKATSFTGPMLFGWLVLIFENQRAGMAIAILFWTIGLMLVLFVKQKDERITQ